MTLLFDRVCNQLAQDTVCLRYGS
uniref:Uncharacterized protein n=1 Tax=Anguilla anguilla TaxID=7936 RepID=A0A0E9R843_ANGAN